MTFISNPKGSPRRVEYDNAKSLLRVICRRTSKDGINFSALEIIIMPDENDPMDRQFYYLAVQRYDGINWGLLGNYNVAEQTMDFGLCFSRDGRSCLRPARGPAVFREPDSFESKSIYASDAMIDAGDHWLLLYRGGTQLHKARWLSHCDCSSCRYENRETPVTWLGYRK